MNKESSKRNHQIFECVEVEKVCLPNSDEKYRSRKKRLLTSTVSVAFHSNVSIKTRIGIMKFQNQDFGGAEESFTSALRELDLQTQCRKESLLAPINNQTHGTSVCLSKYALKDTMMPPEHDSQISFENNAHSCSNECDEGVEMVNEVIMFDDEANWEVVATTLRYNIAQTRLSKLEFCESIAWFKRALTVCSDPFTSFKILHNIGYCNYRIGKTENAMKYFELALPMLSTLGLSKSMMAAVICNCLGVIYSKLHSPELEKAMNMFQRSLRIHHTSGYSSATGVATLLNNIGRVFFLQEKFEKASDVCHQSLQLRRHHLGSDSIDVAATSFNLGNIYQKLRKMRKAVAYYEEFLSIAELKLGLKTREVALTYKYIAEIYEEQKEPELALQNYEKCLEAAEATNAVGHKEIGSILNKAGNLCFEYTKFEDALKYYRLGLELERNHPSGDDALPVVFLTNIAHVYKQQGNIEAALAAYQKAYKFQKICDSTSSSSDQIASTLSSIGLMQYHLKKYERALEAYQEALRIRRRCSLSEISQASTLNSIGLVLFKLGLFDLCKDCFVECLQIRRRLYGSNHKEVAMVWYNLASVAFETGDDDSAQQWYEEALRVERVSLGDDHPDIIVTLVQLGQVKQQCGLLDQAVATFFEALRIERKHSKQDKLCEARLINLIGNCFLQQADTRNMMEAYSTASRLLLESGCEDGFLQIVGYNLYGLAKLCPECASAA